MLTRRQKDVLNFVIDYQRREGGVSPSYDEIAAAVGVVGRSTVCRVMGSLQQRGFIRQLTGQARAIQVVAHPNFDHAVTITRGGSSEVVPMRFIPMERR